MNPTLKQWLVPTIAIAIFLIVWYAVTIVIIVEVIRDTVTISIVIGWITIAVTILIFRWYTIAIIIRIEIIRDAITVRVIVGWVTVAITIFF